MTPWHRGMRLVLPWMLSCGGCSLLCGPDDSPWVSISYDTPEEALASFREAIRREDPVVLAKSLSPDFKQGSGLSGVFEARILFERFPYLYLLGDAEPEPIERRGAGLAVTRATSYGRTVEVRLVRQDYWEVVTDDAGREREYGAFEPWGDKLTLDLDEREGSAQATLRLPAVYAEGLRERDILRIGLGREWKVDGIRELLDPEG